MSDRPARKLKRNGIRYLEIVSTSVAGVTHDGRFIRCGKAWKKWVGNGEKPFDRRLRIKREPSNEHDPNAIIVRWRKLGQLGYVPAPLAAILSPEIDYGIVVVPTVRHFGDFRISDDTGEYMITYMKIGLAVPIKEAGSIRSCIGRLKGGRWRILSKKSEVCVDGY